MTWRWLPSYWRPADKSTFILSCGVKVHVTDFFLEETKKRAHWSTWIDFQRQPACLFDTVHSAYMAQGYIRNSSPFIRRHLHTVEMNYKHFGFETIWLQLHAVCVMYTTTCRISGVDPETLVAVLTTWSWAHLWIWPAIGCFSGFFPVIILQL